jgi:hypothetical protein
MICKSRKLANIKNEKLCLHIKIILVTIMDISIIETKPYPFSYAYVIVILVNILMLMLATSLYISLRSICGQPELTERD